MSLCIVCGKAILPSHPNSCSVCHQPCHAKCAGMRKNAPCNKCRDAQALAAKEKDSANKSEGKPEASGSAKRTSAGTSTGRTRTRTSTTPPPATSKVRVSPAKKSVPQRLPAPTAQSKGKSGSTTPAARGTAQVGGETPGRGSPLLRLLEEAKQARARGSLNGSAAAPNLNSTDKSFSLYVPPAPTLANSTVADAPVLETDNICSDPKVISALFDTTSASSSPLPTEPKDPKDDRKVLMMIPTSTIDLFLLRFDLLQRQFDEIKSCMGRGCACAGNSSADSPAVSVAVEELTSRVSTLQNLVMQQNSELAELRTNSRLLLDENKQLAQQVECLRSNSRARRVDLGDGVNAGTSGSLPPRDCVETAPRSSLAGLPVGVGVACADDDGAAEGCEVILHGIINNEVAVPEDTLQSITFAVLSTVLPSLDRADVVSARVLPSRGRRGEESGGKTSGATSEAALPSSCVARLSSPAAVRDIMRAKRALANNYLTTNDIKPKLLGQSASACVSGRKIYINEVLPHAKFLQFRDLKSTAQGLGFRYVWHAGGRFLVRRRGGERAHVFSTQADLMAIKAACSSPSAARRRSGASGANKGRDGDGVRENSGVESRDEGVAQQNGKDSAKQIN